MFSKLLYLNCFGESKRVEGKKDGRVSCIVLATDLARIKKAADGGETDNWQDLFREIINGGRA